MLYDHGQFWEQRCRVSRYMEQGYHTGKNHFAVCGEQKRLNNIALS